MDLGFGNGLTDHGPRTCSWLLARLSLWPVSRTTDCGPGLKLRLLSLHGQRTADSGQQTETELMFEPCAVADCGLRTADCTCSIRLLSLQVRDGQRTADNRLRLRLAVPTAIWQYLQLRTADCGLRSADSSEHNLCIKIRRTRMQSSGRTAERRHRTKPLNCPQTTDCP